MDILIKLGFHRQEEEFFKENETAGAKQLE